MNVGITKQPSIFRSKSPLIIISAFFILLLFQAFIPLVNFVEIFLFLNLFRLYKRIKLSGQEAFILIVLFSSSTIALIHHNDSDFFTYWHYCIVAPILLFLNGKLIVNESDLKRIVYLISFVCLLVCSLSIFLTPDKIEIKDNQWTGEGVRLFRLFFAHEIVLNGTTIIVFLIPSFAIFFMPAENGLQKIIKVISLFLLVYCVYKAESRSSLIFLLAIFIYNFGNIKLSNKIKYLMLGLISLGVISLFVDLTMFIPERFSVSYTEKAGLTSRDLIWASAYAIISQNFFGVLSPYMDVLGQTFSPHNNFLTYWMLFGWICGITMSYAFIAIEVSAIRKRRSSPRYLVFILSIIFINFFFETASVSIPFSFLFYAMLCGYLLRPHRRPLES